MMKASVFNWGRLLAGILLILFMVLLFNNAPALLFAAPTSVTIAGDLQTELGCPGDWQPDCANTHLAEVGYGVWRAEYTVPAGNWQYKMALNDTWDVSYPADNKGLSLGADTNVRFYFDDKTKAVVDSVNDTVAVAAGSFQSEIGCPGDWQPECVNSLLTDVDGDNIYTFVFTDIPAGDYEFKVALDEDWAEAYPGSDVPFTMVAGATVTISYNATTNDVAVDVATGGTGGPSSVTIAGDLQSEMGCPGDWQPDCADTQLAEFGNGVWRAEYTVPAGDWQYKMALNSTWDESYPASNKGLSLGAAADVRFYFDDKTKAVVDSVNDTVAVAAGSFQSEIGCPGDWQPDCVNSLLTDVDGDNIYTFVFTDIPAGDYEFKVALDEDWAEAYPGGNVPFTMVAGATVTISYNATTNDVSVDVTTGGLEPGDEELVRGSLRADMANEIFYFVLPDRFDNGDSSNDMGGDASGDPLIHGFLPNNKGYYHGGDLAGLTDKLDYLQSLGVTAIWMTPQFTNSWVQGDGTIGGSSAAYHGYWQIDYTQIDPHFGSNAEMQAFINDAHDLGMKVFFDIVINHTGDIITYEEGIFTYRNKADFPYKDASGVIFDDRDYAGTGAFPGLDPAVSFPYTPAFASAEDATAKSPVWLNDPIYYHNRGDSTFTGESSLYGDFFGLDDMFTEHPEVVDGMIDIHKNMITEFGVDGFRVDTVKHVNDELWEEFVPAILEHADAQGINDFFLFGEVFSGDPAVTSRFTTELPFPSVLDFGFDGAATNFAARSQATDQLRDFFATDDYYTDDDSNTYGLVKFVGNHDIGRIGWTIDSSNPGAADAERVARAELGYALAYFSRGIPLVYYGDEQGFTGDGGDKDARQDMMPSLVPSYNDDNLIGTSATTADANFNQTHVLYQTFSDFAQLRDAHVALRQGAQIHRYSEGSAGIYIFSRIDPLERVEYLVVLNNSEAADSATFTTATPSASFTEIYPGGGLPVVSDGAGDVTVSVPALDFLLYQADVPILGGSTAPNIGIVTPSMGDEVTGRVEIGADVSTDAYAEVTFAVSVDGGDYMVIGTDDNAPYRVFYDVSGWLASTELTFKAIVNEDGKLNADKVTVSVGEEAPPPSGGSAPYAVIHYFRDDGDYGDHTTGDYNDFWGLHLWGDIDETIEWTAPKPFLGEDDYGRFAWVKLAPNATDVGFIVHRGDSKDGTDADRFFDPSATAEIWLRQDDPATYTSQADAQGYVTVRYHRPDGDYGDPASPDFNDFWGLHLWGDAIDPSEGTGWTSPKPFDGVDDYGAFWNILIVDTGQPVNFIIHRGDNKDPGPDQSFIPFENASVWIQSGDETIYPSRGAADNTVTLHYHRDAGDYGDPTSQDFNDFWGMHVWTGALNPNPSWQEPVRPVDNDIFGPVFNVPLVPGAVELAYILHKGDEKDPGTDQFLALDKWGYEVWQLEGEGPDPDEPHYVLPVLEVGGGNAGNIAEQSAYWVDESTIAWDTATNPNLTYTLHYAPEGGLEATAEGITGGDSIILVPGALTDTVKAKFPHLADMPGLTIDAADLAMAPEILKGQIAVSAVDAAGLSVNATGLHIPGVLDELYTYDGELGVGWDGDSPTIKVWAPTAKSVTFHLFEDSDTATTSTSMPMTLDPATGVWSIVGEAGWKGNYYLYEVEIYVHSTGQVENNIVTDPYSFSLAMNSTRSQIVDLSDDALKPDGWDDLTKPPLAAPEDISVYEIHVRDFSVNDPSVPDELKGTYKAFTLADTNGINHLEALQEAGLSHLHLLPVFDIATINENRAEWQEPDPDDLATKPPDSEEQQAAVTATEDLDGFNWGYDPLHYTTPEGSYSTNPDGPTRILEFREMVQALNQDVGLRVVMDVVYNHTNASGQAEKSVLDRIVPGYYHRLNDQGAVETSTCCANTASEHNMMEKLMVDSLLVWAAEYKIDAFRFDLMGHHMKSNMLNVRDAFDSLTMAADGVDGSQIYMYGEGWNFGEVADNARGENATQLNMGGTGIGTFSDRLRDAVRGGGPFDSGEDLIRRQGFANGLYYDPNDRNTSPEPAPEPAAVTIAGSLQDELGCPGDWQPECAATHLGFVANDGIWQAIFAVPAGSWEYKAALNNSWDENYGANAEPNGPNIPLNLGAASDVKFYYSHATHWVTDNTNAVIATVPGSFQNALGCPGDWQPDCLRSWLQDPDGDGIYSFSTGDIPPGDYEAKVTINESWDENYGAGGEQNGPNIPFTVKPGQTVLFSYDAVSHVLTISYGDSDQLATLLLLTDQIRVGMAGNLADYEFVDRFGDLVTGKDVDYNGQPAGYTQDPQEDITYISKHDNQTLFDINAYKMPGDATMAERVRAQYVGLSTVLLGQGVPFMHAGSDLLRSKSLDRDSFNSGDWFNRLDFTYQENNFGVGLPVAGKNADNWDIMRPLLANPALKPEKSDIEFSAALFQELLSMRNSSPLFRLQTAADIQARVTFSNTGPSQQPGLIVMNISDLSAVDLDRYNELVVVLVNANDEAQSFIQGGRVGMDLQLHDVQAASVDPVVTTSSFDSATGTFEIPGRTAAVFVLKETPENLISILENDIQTLIDNGDLAANKAEVLFVKLDNALKELEKGKPDQAIKHLEQFIQQVEILVAQGNLAPEYGAALIVEAEIIIACIE